MADAGELPEDRSADDGTDEPFGHEPAGDGTEVDPLLPPVLATPPADAPTMERIPHRYRRSMGSAALAAGMIGLRDILEDPKDSRPVVEQFADEDDRERPIEVDLDPDDPSASTVTVRRPPGGDGPD
jgi:hypothetical protein